VCKILFVVIFLEYTDVHSLVVWRLMRAQLDAVVLGVWSGGSLGCYGVGCYLVGDSWRTGVRRTNAAL
jgi:hypothetical protein